MGGTPLGPAARRISIWPCWTPAPRRTSSRRGCRRERLQDSGRRFRGTNFQTIVGATGQIDLRINDPLGVYAAGFGDRTGAGRR